MRIRKGGLSRRIFVPTVTIFVVSLGLIGVVQRNLYMQSFRTTLDSVKESALELKRAAAKDLLAEIRISTERALQPGEYKQFLNFAQQQNALKEIEEFSFVDPDGKVQLSSKAEGVGRTIDAELWAKVKAAKDELMTEDREQIALLFPLRVDADLKRLSPGWTEGQLYGALYLRFSKAAVNASLQKADGVFTASANKTLMIVVCLSGGTLIVMGFVQMLLVVRPLARSLGKLVTELGGASERLVEVSSQISNSSTHLSEGASTQAASIEEVSSSLEEMAAMTRSNAEGAREASGLANNATAAAKDGDQAIAQLNEAMAKINDSSAQIRAIVKLIQDIAFQTNLLALNAAVEAARAGDAGKGFAVVADEVRNLARKASQATEDITTLIEEAVNRSQEGTRVSSTVGTVFQGISTDINKVSDLIGRIATASQEQAQGAEQVNLSVSQLDKVTQDNAGQAEESAAAAEELSSQAHTLGGMVNGLTELVGGAGSKAA